MRGGNGRDSSAGVLRIGMIGLDNPRVRTFARLLNGGAAPYMAPPAAAANPGAAGAAAQADRGAVTAPGPAPAFAGATLTAAWPGEPSPDFPLSAERLDGFVRELQSDFGVAMLDSIEAVAKECDAWMLEAVDGRTRPELFGIMAAYGKPIFVDKPFALSSGDAERMRRAAARYGAPWMSASSLRHAEALSEAIRAVADAEASPAGGPRFSLAEPPAAGESQLSPEPQAARAARSSAFARSAVRGADLYGPMPMQPTQAGYFWYGIHTAEMLLRALGPGCVEVFAARTQGHDVLTGIWADGRIGTIRGGRAGGESFGGTLHGTRLSHSFEVRASDKPYLESQLEAVIAFLAGGPGPVDPRETLEIVRFLEAANRSAETGVRVKLQGSSTNTAQAPDKEA
ncbi:gfo/Idh/MocA family oxidoreductase [Saccharibacillus sp. CPCC 101409]|uniref:gfo/Idh/MocA family oxidoreductase n=1 Tax=Saccharibacillus sp. CPCC 101409 TaxID=3058041 RepID=UPI0026711E8C|nr:gfo/Idh/MocA family oxidoreductase [Saccharibacillus sp. CPCC 101409]MDO3409965.1 gfo/Idh/MocA family oxidoreductase [Saccharibacillus sp. CPCC 101409]